MKQKNDGEKPHYLRLALAGVGILLLLALNYLYFREKTSSNSELITRYTRKADPMELKKSIVPYMQLYFSLVPSFVLRRRPANA